MSACDILFVHRQNEWLQKKKKKANSLKDINTLGPKDLVLATQQDIEQTKCCLLCFSLQSEEPK